MRWPWTKDKASSKAEPEADGEGDGFFGRLDRYDIPRSGISRAEVRAKTIAAVNQMTFDSADYGSVHAVTGGQVPDNMLMWYAAGGFPGYSTLALMAQHWMVQKACKLPAKDAAKEGWALSVEPDLKRKIARLDKRYKVHANLVEACHFARLYGVRVVMYKVRPPEGVRESDYLASPFNLDGVTPGSYLGMHQIDPLWCVPILDSSAANDPASMSYQVPTYWQINGKKVHKSHLVVIVPEEVPDILKACYQYGGLSVTQKIYERVYAAERIANEAPALAFTKRLNVQKVSDLGKAIAQQGGFEARARIQSEYRDNFGTLFLGRDDSYETHETSLAGLDTLLIQQYELVACIANIPVTKFLGQSPKGFNATGSYDEASYLQELESIQSDQYEPMLDRHYKLLARSEGLPIDGAEIVWPPMDSPTKLELADIQLKQAQTAQIYCDIGALDGTQVQSKLFADKDSGYDATQLE